ncbi:hypothetical protein [Nocardiopsis lucentensis]|uniref:hypothetical protein n=1 Tax=Nocardiopsis lucentensis TaxID=53441 RepID=UPI000346B3EA|nr:hypothetical protein [Nocardiopsis lucentensis]
MPFPWLAGMRVTAERLNEHNPVYAYKSVNEDRTNTTTVAPDSDLTLTLGDGVWDIHAMIDYAGTANSGGIRVSWSTTMTTVSLRAVQGPTATSTNRLDTNMRSAVHGMGTEAEYGNTQGSGLRAAAREGFILQGPGTITLEWAQITSHADPTTLSDDSYLRAQRVG